MMGVIECTENNLNNSCKIYCDGNPTTVCGVIETYSTNGYCKDVALLCYLGNDCLIDSSKIYYGYDEITNYCELEIRSSGKFECSNTGIL